MWGREIRDRDRIIPPREVPTLGAVELVSRTGGGASEGWTTRHWPREALRISHLRWHEVLPADGVLVPDERAASDGSSTPHVVVSRKARVQVS